MSVNKLGIILFSGFLMFAMAPVAPAQSTTQDTTKKQTTTTQKGTVSKDSGKTTTSDTQSTEKSATSEKTKSQRTEKNAHAASSDKNVGTADTEKKGTTTEKSTEKSTTANKKATGKKSSSLAKEKVRTVQTSLKSQGFDPGPIDGVMGVMTMTALRNYQSHNGLQVTGNLDAETENALQGNATARSTSRNENQNFRNDQNNQSYNQNQQNQQSYNQNQGLNQDQSRRSQDLSQNNSQDQSTRDSLGVSGQGTVSSVEDTRQMQQALSDLGYNPGDVNGMMSSQTQQAIKEFQWLNSMPVTGNIDEQTKISINTQSQGGFESARVNQTYNSTSLEREKPGVTTQEQSSTSSSLDREKPATTEEQPNSSSNLEREKPGISSEEQTQTRTDRSTSSSSSSTSSSTSPSTQTRDKSYDTTHDTTVDHSSTKHSDSTADVKQDRDRDKDRDAKNHDKSSSKPDKDLSNRVSKAAAVLQDLTASADKRIPNELLERAEAIAVIPNMIKGAFGIGGRFGKGVVAQRSDNGRWSSPSFLEVGGGSFGAQLGVTSTDLVLVFTDRKALSLLEGGKDLKLGVDAGVAAGPVGRSAEAGVNAKLDTAIYAYSRSKGLFAGIALDGAVLNIDKDANEKVYGSSANAEDILNGKAAMNSTVRPFMDALEKAVPKKRISQK
jgi:lipid-binding SYLF domain-containing protein